MFESPIIFVLVQPENKIHAEASKKNTFTKWQFFIFCKGIVNFIGYLVKPQIQGNAKELPPQNFKRARNLLLVFRIHFLNDKLEHIVYHAADKSKKYCAGNNGKKQNYIKHKKPRLKISWKNMRKPQRLL